MDQQKCEYGLRALQNYRRDYNDKLEQFKPVPVHDWASHGADAFGEGAINIQKMRPIQDVPIVAPPTIINYW